MKKVNLDEEYGRWKDKNKEDLIERWNEIEEDKFDEFIEDCWREYQDEEGLTQENY